MGCTSTAAASTADAVILNAVDSDAAGPAAKALNEADVPIVAVDRAVNGADVASFVASDNVAGGEQAAKALAEAIGEKGEVIVLQGVAGTSASRDRGEGFTKGISAYPDITVVAQQTANFDRATALDVTIHLGRGPGGRREVQSLAVPVRGSDGLVVMRTAVSLTGGTLARGPAARELAAVLSERLP